MLSAVLDFDNCYAAIRAKDARFDGWFYTAVTSTGVYCRPSCPARTPLQRNVAFYATAAAAQQAGFRACKRCRPEAAPGSPEWDSRGDLVGRSMRLIADGVVDREGVAGLARRVGFTERHLHRCLVDAVGAGPLALARARRAQTARLLLERTDLTAAQVALSAGFRSVRQFNTSIREIFAATPSELRARRRPAALGGEPGVTVSLPYRAPFDAGRLLAFFAARAVPGVEEVEGGCYRRSLRLPHGPGVVELEPRDGNVRATFWLADMRDFAPALDRCRQLFDLDADPAAIGERLGADPLIGAAVRARPGLRVPGGGDGHETATRALLGQQVSLAAARTHAARLVAAHGEPLAAPVGRVTHLFPSADALAAIRPEELALPAARARALVCLARGAAAGELALDCGADRVAAREALCALPGVGEWTAAYVAMRALRDPDAFIAGDLGVRRALAALGHDGGPRVQLQLAEAWRPYRAYAVMHLWAMPLAARHTGAGLRRRSREAVAA